MIKSLPNSTLNSRLYSAKPKQSQQRKSYCSPLSHNRRRIIFCPGAAFSGQTNHFLEHSKRYFNVYKVPRCNSINSFKQSSLFQVFFFKYFIPGQKGLDGLGRRRKCWGGEIRPPMLKTFIMLVIMIIIVVACKI